ncbi:fatty acid--CoA ligase family protein [Sphingobium sufflavum]|uniref:class I adenylate-forming enzyme family protein n=1 Tax=Sphingobium sufflavum TaxID=1129547 RepID=UPI001F47BE6E|nr:fatty acid--CoA ligase family protein [Sphingobium sufflavum]MCE7796926.1 fatty acid--CoA ligase family protein [Sphingobium sufflavum]
MTTDILAEAQSLQQAIRGALDRDPTIRAIEYEGRWYDWGEIRAVADQVAAAVQASGAAQEQAVALIPRNRPSAVAALLGLLAQGRTVQMIYAFQKPAAIAGNIEKLRPSVIVGAASEVGGEVEALCRAKGIAVIIIDEMTVQAAPGLDRATCEPDPDAPAEPQIQILTSGTTGPPKQCPFPHSMFFEHHIKPGMLSQQTSPSTTPFLASFPLGNISGVYSTLPTMVRGIPMVLVDRFTIDAWHDWVVRYRPVQGGLPPAGVQMVLDKNYPKEDLASIQMVGTGAAPLDPTVQRAFEDRYGIPIILSYGATEFGGPVVGMTLDLVKQWGQQKLGSVGKVMPGMQVRVVDPDTGVEKPAGEEGIVEVVSKRIGPDWIRTSDVAIFDADGFMWHRGRADGAIMRGGFKVLPESIERALRLHPAIAVAAVTAKKDRRLSEVPAAAIQLKPGVPVPEIAELEAHLREHLPSTHIPTVWRFVDDIPKNRSAKIDRPALKAMFEEEGAE